MKSVLIGTVQFTRACLAHLIARGAAPAGVVARRAAPGNADFAPLDDLCAESGIDIHYSDDVNGAETVGWLNALAPEVIFCFGWSRLLKADVLAIPPKGVVGYHPAFLPQNRGRHPIIWALALGLDETGSTFFYMDEGADSGDIISQRRIAIGPDDDAGILYRRMIETALAQLDDFLPYLADGAAPRLPQDRSAANSWRRRTAADGRIDWRMPARGIHNLVRALAAPYPGATVRRGDRDQIVWRTRIESAGGPRNIEPGKVLAVDDRKIVVRAADGAVALIHHELDPVPAVGDYL
jgi:methionyl-tRNA formyltransferase